MAWQLYPGGIYGWKAQKAEVGDCRIYNNGAWGCFGDNQCIELDSDRNQRYTQVINICETLYASLLLHVEQVQGTSCATSSASLALDEAVCQHETAVAQYQQIIQCSINMATSDFNDYLCNLYDMVNAHLTYEFNNQLVEIHQYGCCTTHWIEQYGQCTYPYFSCSGYNNQYLQKAKCKISSIFGNIINCEDCGNHYHLQLSTCTHL